MVVVDGFVRHEIENVLSESNVGLPRMLFFADEDLSCIRCRLGTARKQTFSCIIIATKKCVVYSLPAQVEYYIMTNFLVMPALPNVFFFLSSISRGGKI